MVGDPIRSDRARFGSSTMHVSVFAPRVGTLRRIGISTRFAPAPPPLTEAPHAAATPGPPGGKSRDSPG
jgi:hypothetical protein